MGRALARRVRPEVLEGEPFDVERALDITLVSEFGIDVRLEPLPTGVQGLTEPPNRLTLPEDVYMGLRHDPRHRYTGAHELTHAVLHLPH